MEVLRVCVCVTSQLCRFQSALPHSTVQLAAACTMSRTRTQSDCSLLWLHGMQLQTDDGERHRFDNVDEF